MLRGARAMKIGEFSGMFHLTPQTVRFYINKGLLVPASRNDRYAFSPQDAEDMELLLKLKRLRFSLSEIHRIVSLKRLSNFDSADELNDYISILKKQKKALTWEKTRLQETLSELEREIAGAAGKHTGQAKRANGVPLAFLPYLACPHCQRDLSVKECNIEKDQLSSGTLLCACGYRAGIQNGIVVGEQGEVSVYDGPDLERNCYRMMSPDLITLMKKNYQWMLERLEHCGMKGRLVLEDFVNDYCFCHANFENMDPGALYVITDKFPGIVAMYKNLIDRMNLEHQAVYRRRGAFAAPAREERGHLRRSYDERVRDVPSGVRDGRADPLFSRGLPGCRRLLAFRRSVRVSTRIAAAVPGRVRPEFRRRLLSGLPRITVGRGA